MKTNFTGKVAISSKKQRRLCGNDDIQLDRAYPGRADATEANYVSFYSKSRVFLSP